MGPRTQRQRRDDMQRAVLDAAVESLVELGFARTTTLEVQRRAGISRGALLHHFPSKEQLLIAAVHHLARMRGRELTQQEARLPEGGAPRISAAIDLLWESFSGPLFQVAMELRTAARTDPELRGALARAELELGERIRDQARRLFGVAIASRAGFEAALDFSFQTMMGAAMAAILHGDSGRVAALIEHLKFVFPTLLERAHP